MYIVKLAVMLILMGGVAKQDKSGSKTRGEAHMLLVGDPGLFVDYNCFDCESLFRRNWQIPISAILGPSCLSICVDHWFVNQLMSLLNNLALRNRIHERWIDSYCCQRQW